jgi:hypothetical protein
VLDRSVPARCEAIGDGPLLSGKMRGFRGAAPRLADDARVSAARIDDPDGKRRMLEMAAAYDQFAEEAEQR